MSEFYRIFTPRTEKAVKAISLLANGVRYKPTEEEVEKTLEALKEAVNDIAVRYGVLPVEKDVTAADNQGDSQVETSRIDAKIASIKASPFAREDVGANIRRIPEAQLTAYATQIVARLCSKYEDPEAQPKNYVAKEED